MMGYIEFDMDQEILDEEEEEQEEEECKKEILFPRLRLEEHNFEEDKAESK